MMSITTMIAALQKQDLNTSDMYSSSLTTVELRSWLEGSCPKIFYTRERTNLLSL